MARIQTRSEYWKELEAGARGTYQCSMQFFKPSDTFLDDLIARFPGGLFVDAGCGLGHLTKALRERGAKCMPLDLHPTESAQLKRHEIMPISAPDFQYTEGMVVIMARPNPGHWIEQTFDQTRACQVPLVYVGKPANQARDIDGLTYAPERWLENVGEENEVAWVITADDPESAWYREAQRELELEAAIQHSEKEAYAEYLNGARI